MASTQVRFLMTHRFIAVFCTLLVSINVLQAQPYVFQDRVYDYKVEFSSYGYTAPTDILPSVCNQPMTIYLSRYGQVTVVLPDQVMTGIFNECHAQLPIAGGIFDLLFLVGEYESYFEGEDFKYSVISQDHTFYYKGATYMGGKKINTNPDEWLEVHRLVEDGKFQLGNSGAPLSTQAVEAHERERRVAEMREQQRKREEAEAARRKAAEEEELRRKEEEARFRAQPISARTDAKEVPEKLAAFPDGEAKLIQYFGENMKYPAIAQKMGIEGRVIVRFIVEPDGSFSSVEVVKSPDPSLGKEAVRLIKSMPHWFPATIKGVPVPSIVTQTIAFKL